MPGAFPSSQFVHLHVHTDYSMLDGAARVQDLMDRANELGQPAMATTDHGFIFGAYDFWAKAKKNGIKPVIGLEAYLTPGTARQDRTRVKWGDDTNPGDDVSAGGAYTHMTLWAQNTPGMHNLFRMASLASIEGTFYKPRMDRDLFQRYAAGLIGTSGCPSGEIQTRLRLGQYDEAVKAAGEFQDILGKENFYVELMYHGLDIEKRVLEDLIRLGKEIDAPFVATNDLHYVRHEDWKSQAALLCVQSGKTIDDPTRFKFDADDFYLKSAKEMRELWKDLPQACDATLEIAERCEVEFVESVGKYMPEYDVPAGEDEVSWFVKEVEAGLARRFPDGVPAEVHDQATYEIEVVTSKGYGGYYLVVADFINWAKENGIRVGPGRGSGAGSMAAYALGITELDPLKHGLIFERFLNPERESMPDFDVDFDERRRGEVIRYVTEKYGADKVAQIVTYGTIKAKQALKDSARVLGYPFGVGEKLTKAMPPAIMGKDMKLSAMFDQEDERYGEAEEFRQLVAGDPDAQKVLETAKGLEGLKRQWGVHAAGVIMSRANILDIIPVMRREQDGAIITQFDYPTCEGLGLVKMDFLGLRNLTILDDALENILLNGKPAIELESLPLDDQETYDLLSRGDSVGVFQLDGGGMRTLMRQLRPDNFEDISALVALYRPGPMGADSHTNYALRKNGLQPIEPIHPELEEPLKDILDTSYGLIIYQEQVMAIAQKVAGYTLGQADLLRRAMGKKKKEILDKEFKPFSEGMRANGFSEAAITKLWDILVPFSSYAFNKAHSAAYGLVAYWTAYLKTHYPVEYMAALLTSTKGDKDKSAVYLGEARRMGTTVLPPDVNESAANFTPVGTDVRFGLTAVRNVGANVVELIRQTREEKGAFTSFQDFLDKVPIGVCNKRVIESLIKSGGFDSFGTSRRALMARHADAIDAVTDLKRKQAVGQFDLFGSFGDSEGPQDGAVSGGFEQSVEDLPEWDRATKLAFEREMLGLYVSDHPLRGLERVLAENSDCSVSRLVSDDEREDGSRVQIAGLITSLQRKTTKAGALYAIAVVEDLDAAIEVLMFPKVYSEIGAKLANDVIVSVTGRFSRRDERVSLHASFVNFPDVGTHDGEEKPVTITLPAQRMTPSFAERLKSVLSDHPGAAEVRVKLLSPGKSTVLRLSDSLRVRASSDLFGDLKAVVGPDCLG